MEGKRFGVGLAAGLLLGLGIIAASGALGSSPAIFGPALGPSQAGTRSLTTTVNTVATTATMTATLSTSTSGSPAYSVNHTNSTNGSGSLSNIPSSVSSTTSQSQKNITFGSSGAKSPSYSSRIVSIAQQPLLSNAVIFVPVLVAFLLGAILYQASNRNRKESEKSQSQR
jgi:hypothetical protein